jgi:para-aminobenzoate synthetase component II
MGVAGAGKPRVVVIDNYDSFTYNLAQSLWMAGADAHVFEHDRIDLGGIRALDPTHLVISPGPGTAEREADLGISTRAIAALSPAIPTLGVCLGHQAIAHLFGGRIARAPKVMHGKTSLVRHHGAGIYIGLPSPFPAMRYHSLVAERDTLPECLSIEAETEDGSIMGLRHREWPLFGVQFHPESVGTPDGQRLMVNFLALR